MAASDRPTHDRKTGPRDVGEGMLWRSKVEPTGGGRNALVAVRLKVDRGQISEIEQLTTAISTMQLFRY